MSPKVSILLVIFLLHTITVVLASDPDPIQDYCLPSTSTSPSHHNSPASCRNSSSVTIEDFVFSGIKSPGKFKNGFSGVPVSSSVFPGLNTLGMSLVRADFEVGGVNVPHFHPRATEVAYVLEGRIYSGFIDSGNKIFAKVLEKGDVMVFPRGLLHFQMNVGKTRAAILGSFNSQNPGTLRMPSALFGSGINEELLEKAFGLKSKDVSKLKKRFGPQEEEH